MHGRMCNNIALDATVPTPKIEQLKMSPDLAVCPVAGAGWGAISAQLRTTGSK